VRPGRRQPPVDRRRGHPDQQRGGVLVDGQLPHRRSTGTSSGRIGASRFPAGAFSTAQHFSGAATTLASYFGARGRTTRGLSACFKARRAKSRLNPVTAHTESKISVFTAREPDRYRVAWAFVFA